MHFRLSIPCGLLLSMYVILNAQQTYIWTGTIDTDWHKPCNWNPFGLPTCADTVIIPTVSSGNYPVISGVGHCKELNIITNVSNALTITGSGRIDISAGGGSCLGMITNNLGSLTPSVQIQGLKVGCSGEQMVWKAPHAQGATWQWQYPAGWQLVAQNGDSIVLIPDTIDGYIKTMVCDNNCNCSVDSLFIIADSCKTLCLALGDFMVARANATEFFGRSIIQTSDGGYAVAAYGRRIGIIISYMYAAKLDRNGNMQWAKKTPGAYDAGYSIIQTTDKGYAIVGYRDIDFISSGGLGNLQVYVIKLDSNGAPQWGRTIGDRGTDIGYSIIQTTDGGYAIAGQRGGDFYVIKLDATGNLRWTRTIGGANGDFGYSIVQTWDGGLAIAGYTTSFGAGNED
ncbi:MAG: hypothetical protein GXO48_02815, partial [Chlorobi bacterium]|nr:hypothetical protein [Chlorobiota bacterium]